MSSMMKGELPSKPDGAMNTEDFELLWDCCCLCWGAEPVNRPAVLELKARLKVSLSRFTDVNISAKGGYSTNFSVQILARRNYSDGRFPDIPHRQVSGYQE
jgi:hypothetical protein